MGKKSKAKQWLVKFRNLPTVQVMAKTEGSAKTQVFQFLVNQKILLPGMNVTFHNEARVGILKKAENATETGLSPDSSEPLLSPN